MYGNQFGELAKAVTNKKRGESPPKQKTCGNIRPPQASVLSNINSESVQARKFNHAPSALLSQIAESRHPGL